MTSNVEEWKRTDSDESGYSLLSVSDSTEDSSWISYFCGLRGNEFLCEVDEEFIQDEFNLTGLSQVVPFYDSAWEVILNFDSPNERDWNSKELEQIEQSAELLYGLIHARYILTNAGMQAMREKYENVHFGRCFRVLCEGQPLLPVGQSDIANCCTVNMYCLRCCEIYFPRSVRQAALDGAYFGTTFAHLFQLRYIDSLPPQSTHVYVPRIYGFRIHRESKFWKRQDDNRNEDRKQRSHHDEAGIGRWKGY